MTWKITLTNGIAYYTDSPLDFERMGQERWICIAAIERCGANGLIRNRTTKTWLNIAQITSIEEAKQ